MARRWEYKKGNRITNYESKIIGHQDKRNKNKNRQDSS